ncbi:uncharacterized protein CCHa1 [Epargyreus clarus]|uniref:uncharacterized protein CCHa1 n=1 Tax=Epargyreus clarus TaxID=520877 RepID=UPI003C3074B7
MDKQRSSSTKASSSRASVTGILALLLFICLAECATEQRINSRGSKSSNLIEKVNGWRSQRGGSCLSYGHSCWGAHGKRSGKPASAPDWYLTRILRRMAASADLNRARQLTKNDDMDDIFRVEITDDAPATNRLVEENEDAPMDLGSRTPEAKPMLDDELLSKIKIWQMMKEASEDK